MPISTPAVSTGTANPTPNPAPPLSRTQLHIIVFIFRFLQTIGKWCDHYLSLPLPNSPAHKLSIPSTISKTPGSIPLLFYTPKSYNFPTKSKQQTQQQQPLLPSQKEKHPIVINLHGGGYTIGSATDDARWCTQLTQSTFTSSTSSEPSLPPVVISIEYRLAPTYPFPTGIEDVVSAILWIWSHADEYNLDINKTTLSGFSAGGQFCFTALYRLHFEMERLHEQGQLEDVVLGKIVSLVAFYPPTDWTKSRSERAESNPNFQVSIPPILSQVMEQSYLRPIEGQARDMSDPLLSPGLASDELIQKALPRKMVIVTCWGDGLLGEAEVFRERLKRLGKVVEGYTVPDISHGWDKWPSWWKGNVKRDEAYARAVGWLGEHLEDVVD